MENTKAKEAAEPTVATETKPSASHDWMGVAIGMVTFLFGLALLIMTFRHAATMFAIPARETLGNEKDVTELGKTFGHVILRIGLLLVMSIVGSIITGQGIRLYLAARSRNS